MKKRVKINIQKRSPWTPSKNTAKLAIKMFESAGRSTHSKYAVTLQYVIDHCEKNGIPYRLSAWPGHGYEVEKIKGLE